ncbi:TonB family C-terminal domain-containing protein [Thermomonas hydrothermalis]|uniref:Protein TonB n=2 Tax=Thermomonas hydrothermalis TaxID=213588 RepID=A0A1M4WP88_9GAMM|nr:TonB family C-terminal domain-containing protein [Thermomonas hydrothermalis]
MAVIAADQALAREDFEEAKRLIRLIGKADPNHPALGRLKTSLASSEAAAKKRAESMPAEDEAKRKAELAKQREEDQKKLQEQQRQQQAQAEQQRQQQAAAEAEAERLRQQQAAAAEAERQRQQQATQQAAQQQTAAPAPRPAAATTELRPISQPGPKYPPAAQRAGAGGSVQVEYTVGTDGSVISARVVSSDAPRQFQRDFEREALAAVKRWRFQPVAQPVTSRRTIEFAM